MNEMSSLHEAILMCGLGYLGGMLIEKLTHKNNEDDPDFKKESQNDRNLRYFYKGMAFAIGIFCVTRFGYPYFIEASRIGEAWWFAIAGIGFLGVAVGAVLEKVALKNKNTNASVMSGYIIFLSLYIFAFAAVLMINSYVWLHWVSGGILPIGSYAESETGVNLRTSWLFLMFWVDAIAYAFLPIFFAFRKSSNISKLVYEVEEKKDKSN